MKRLGALVLLVLAATAPALALPRDREATFAHWFASNVALTQRKIHKDENTGGNDYDATVRVAGTSYRFFAVSDSGFISFEYLQAAHAGEKWSAPISAVYGAPYGVDFSAATHVGTWRGVSVYKGKLLAYASFNEFLYPMPLDSLNAVIKNAKSCGAIQCED